MYVRFCKNGSTKFQNNVCIKTINHLLVNTKSYCRKLSKMSRINVTRNEMILDKSYILWFCGNSPRCYLLYGSNYLVDKGSYDNPSTKRSYWLWNSILILICEQFFFILPKFWSISDLINKKLYNLARQPKDLTNTGRKMWFPCNSSPIFLLIQIQLMLDY